MKKNKKAMIASLALVGAVCVGSTLAYLSDQSNTLNNTFTVGKGYIPGDLGEAVWVDEKDYNGATEGEKTTTVDGELRTLDGNQYGTVDNKLEAGSVVTKDPVIRLTEESVESWVYMQVTYKTDDLYKFVDAKGTADKVLEEIVPSDWTVIDATTSDGNTVLTVRFNTMLNSAKTYEDGTWVDTTEIHNTSALFEAIQIDETFNLEGDAEPTISPITIKACAVQAAYTDNGTKVYLVPNDLDPDNGADAPTFGA